MPKTRLFVSCAIIALVSVPLIMRWVPPNAWYGFRTATTLSSADIWYRTNTFAGWALLAAALTTVAVAWFVPGRLWLTWWFPAVALLGPLAIAVVVAFVYLAIPTKQ